MVLRNQIALRDICKHNDVDFMSRIILWCLAKDLVKKIYRFEFRDVSGITGWKKLFEIELLKNQED